MKTLIGLSLCLCVAGCAPSMSKTDLGNGYTYFKAGDFNSMVVWVDTPAGVVQGQGSPYGQMLTSLAGDAVLALGFVGAGALVSNANFYPSSVTIAR